MSDPIIPPSPPADASPPPATPPGKPIKPKKKKRTWGQRFKILVLVLLIGACLLRVALNWVLPTVINRVAGLYGLECGYDRLGLSLLGGHANLYGLKLRPQGGGDSLMQADYIEGDLSVLQLFQGRLVVFRAEVDGVVVAIDREADGSLPILQKFMAAKAAAPAGTAMPVAATQPTSPYNLNPPLRVDAIRLSHVRARIRDKSVSPTFEAMVSTTLRVSDVGRSDGPTKFELDVGVEPLLDTLRVSGTATTTADSLKADVSLLMRGLHPKRAAAYLKPLGLVPVADDMTVKADVSVDARTIPNSADVTASISASNVSAVADGAEWASLGSMRLDAKRLSAAAAELDRLALADGLATAHRNANGGIEVAGLRLAPAETVAATTQPAVPPAAPSTSTPIAVTSGPPFRLSLGELVAKNFTATVTDANVSPAATLVARLDALSVRNIDTASDKAIPVAAEIALPGILRRVTVTGQVAPLAATRTASFKFVGDGLRPDAIKPYLAPFGVESLLSDARFGADLDASVTQAADGTITADAGVANVKLIDQDASLIELAAAKITGLSFTPKTGAIAVKDVNLSGPALTVTRDPDERISAVGFKLVGTPTTRPQPVAAGVNPREAGVTAGAANAARVDIRGQAAVPATQPSLPRIELGHLKWTDLKLTLDDKATPGAQPFVLSDVGVDVSNLLLDLSAPDAGGRPGEFTAYVAAPGLADTFTVSGVFTPKPNQLVTTIDVAGDGLSGDRIAAYVRPFGIEPTLKNGRLAAKVTATVTQTNNGQIVGDLQGGDVTYADGGTELAGVDYFKLANLRVTPKRIDLDELTARKPRVRVPRAADGTFLAGGVHLLPATRPTTAPMAAGVGTHGPATEPTGSPFLTPLPIEIGLKKLDVQNATLDWSDAAAAKPVDLHVVAGITMDDVNVAPDARPAHLYATAKVDGVMDARVQGTVTPSPVAPAVDFRIDARDVRPGPLVAYLPPTIEPLVQEGVFTAFLKAAAANHADGGVAATLNVSALQWLDRTPVPDLNTTLPSLMLIARRIDPAAGVFDIDTLALSGARLSVRQTNEGLQAAGIRLRNAPPPAAASTQPAAPPATAPAELPQVKSVAVMVADSRRPMPRLSIDRLAIDVSRLALGGFAGDGNADVTLRDLNVSSPGSITVGGPDTDNNPPLRLDVAGGIDVGPESAADTLVRRFQVFMQATPFATEPAVKIAVNAAGLNGVGLTTLVPALKQTIDGSELKDGTFATNVDASINYGRRGPRDFDVGRGFTASFEVKPVELRQTADGPVIAGVKGVRADAIKVSPATGDVSVKALEIDTPIARVMRDDKGIHAAGLIAKIGANEPVENLTPTTQPTPAVVPQASAEPAEAAKTERPKNEIRLDRLTVSGVDVTIEDHTATPHTVVPLKSLDVDVQNLSNQLPWNAKSVRFGVLVTSDKVAMPPRKGAKGEATTQPAAGEYTEQRDLFSQITASGKVGFVRRGDVAALDGWAKTAVNGFELLGVRGLAKQYNVTVGGGAFDDTNDIKFNPNGNIETKNRIVFTNLALSEPENGPLRRLLKLPTPIDVAIGAVTDPDGSITLNVPVPVKNGAVKVGDVVGPALGAVTNVLVTAIASAPVKAVQGLGSLVGFGNKDVVPEPPVVLPFLPAYAGLGREARQSLQTLQKQLAEDPLLELQVRHTLSDADVARTATRVNPPPAQCLVLAEQVRKQRAALEAQYAVLAAEARGDFGAQASARGKQATDALRDVGRQLAAADQSMDELYALGTSSATGLADRRTRTAALAIAQKRLDTVRDDLAGGNDAIAKRISLMNAQFDPAVTGAGGEVTIVLVRKKQ